jgi:hypothetical protein
MPLAYHATRKYALQSPDPDGLSVNARAWKIDLGAPIRSWIIVRIGCVVWLRVRIPAQLGGEGQPFVSIQVFLPSMHDLPNGRPSSPEENSKT